ncbi:MAG: VOC family protein [Gammaproteobacteria bacterium]|nr:VOC family protein [Gammaproteobacteria bacterium]
MKRLHVHVAVKDLDASVRFYRTLFAAEPVVLETDYAKWMLDDPRVNFAISQRGGAGGIEHLGIQTETADELQDVYSRLQQAQRPVLDEGSTACCYAKSTKQWISDPQGVSWEAFLTNGESTEFGDAPDLSALTAEGACCAPRAAQAVCCTPAVTEQDACCAS